MEKLIEVDWAGIFIPTHSLAEMVVRGSLMYVALFLILRFVMKRQTGSVGIADILVIVVIADAAQNAFSKQYQSFGEGVVLVATIVFWDFLIDWLSFAYKPFGKLMQPPPLPLIKNGKLLRRNMRQEFITLEELKSLLRREGVEDIADVKAALIEADGAISVIKKASAG
jgi:uncharacterized membrane protein YcaP (DUF421 family)